jgi:hypothetical protein
VSHTVRRAEEGFAWIALRHNRRVGQPAQFKEFAHNGQLDRLCGSAADELQSH